MTTTTTFTPTQTTAYLDRIGDTGLTEPVAETLEGIYRAHQLSVPFENFDILPLGRPLQLEAEAIYDKIVRRHRGGYCYELNGLLATVLRDQGPLCTIATPTGRVTFSQNRLFITNGANREERSVAPDEVAAILRHYFQFDLER